MINRETNVQKIDLTGADYYRRAFPSALKISDVYLYYVENISIFLLAKITKLFQDKNNNLYLLYTLLSQITFLLTQY